MSHGARQPAAPRRRSTRGETTGVRPSTWSRWHRHALPAWAFCCDLDALEIRANRGVVAVLELSQVEGRLTEARVLGIHRSKPLQTRAVAELAEALHVPGLLVVHTRDMAQFGLLGVTTREVRLMNETEFRSFLERL